MDLKGYLIHLVEANNIAPGLMPVMIFIVGAFVGFSTGSSWGVWAITMPIALPIAAQFGIPMELMIGACLSGGVFGDHCSPTVSYTHLLIIKYLGIFCSCVCNMVNENLIMNLLVNGNMLFTNNQFDNPARLTTRPASVSRNQGKLQDAL